MCKGLAWHADSDDNYVPYHQAAGVSASVFCAESVRVLDSVFDA